MFGGLILQNGPDLVLVDCRQSDDQQELFYFQFLRSDSIGIDKIDDVPMKVESFAIMN